MLLGQILKIFLGKFVDTNELRGMAEMLGFTLKEYAGIWQTSASASKP